MLIFSLTLTLTITAIIRFCARWKNGSIWTREIQIEFKYGTLQQSEKAPSWFEGYTLEALGDSSDWFAVLQVRSL